MTRAKTRVIGERINAGISRLALSLNQRPQQPVSLLRIALGLLSPAR
jgi:hypothetical protein